MIMQYQLKVGIIPADLSIAQVTPLDNNNFKNIFSPFVENSTKYLAEKSIRGQVMFIKQSDLLWGLDNNFIKEFIASAMKKTHPEGYNLFNAGEAADNFYILIKGKIRLTVGKQKKTTYLVEHAGEAFGWSGLVGMPKYSASAECIEESIVMIFAKEFVTDVTDSDPANGMRFYRRLARMLGNRLIHSYQIETDGLTDEAQYNPKMDQKIESLQHP